MFADSNCFKPRLLQGNSKGACRDRRDLCEVGAKLEVDWRAIGERGGER